VNSVTDLLRRRCRARARRRARAGTSGLRSPGSWLLLRVSLDTTWRVIPRAVHGAQYTSALEGGLGGFRYYKSASQHTRARHIDTRQRRHSPINTGIRPHAAANKEMSVTTMHKEEEKPWQPRVDREAEFNPFVNPLDRELDRSAPLEDDDVENDEPAVDTKEAVTAAASINSA
jgi:hypothetical protein